MNTLIMITTWRLDSVLHLLQDVGVSIKKYDSNYLLAEEFLVFNFYGALRAL